MKFRRLSHCGINIPLSRLKVTSLLYIKEALPNSAYLFATQETFIGIRDIPVKPAPAFLRILHIVPLDQRACDICSTFHTQIVPQITTTTSILEAPTKYPGMLVVC